MAVFQATLLVAVQRTGTPVSRLVPSPRGPRQPGQSSAESTPRVARHPRNRTQSRDGRVIGMMVVVGRWPVTFPESEGLHKSFGCASFRTHCSAPAGRGVGAARRPYLPSALLAAGRVNYPG